MESRQVDVDHADGQLIAEAAARLRNAAITDEYRGASAKHYAFAVALVLDELGRHVRGLHPEVRQQTVLTARALLDETTQDLTHDALIDVTGVTVADMRERAGRPASVDHRPAGRGGAGI